jgi:hypothetical protein
MELPLSQHKETAVRRPWFLSEKGDSASAEALNESNWG